MKQLQNQNEFNSAQEMQLRALCKKIEKLSKGY